MLSGSDNMKGIFGGWESAESGNKRRYEMNQKDITDHIETNKNAAKKGITSGKEMNNYKRENGVFQ